MVSPASITPLPLFASSIEDLSQIKVSNNDNSGLGANFKDCSISIPLKLEYLVNPNSFKRLGIMTSAFPVPII